MTQFEIEKMDVNHAIRILTRVKEKLEFIENEVKTRKNGFVTGIGQDISLSIRNYLEEVCGCLDHVERRVNHGYYSVR